jgi:peptidoglycan/xylan/chitin deacetylase (PgdA/CDA1 family)
MPARAFVPSYAATSHRRKVWLTFDDGPHPSYTLRVLNTLAAHGIKATFFVVGRNCNSFMDVLARTAAAGHRIANHTYNHSDLRRLSEARVRDELRRTEALIGRYVRGPKLMRPPYGAHNGLVDRVVRGLGYRMVLWNVDTVDWSQAYKPDKWVTHGLNQIRARADSVVLNHDVHKTTADHLDRFIRRIEALGNVTFGAPADL